MRRSNAVEVEVVAPSKGLQTRLPSNATSPDKRAVVVAENVRAEQGVLRNAPGYERIAMSIRNVDSPVNMIWQANLLDADKEVQMTPFVGTATSLFTVKRRSQELICDVDGAGTRSCTVTGAILGDSGDPGVNLLAVSELIKARVASNGIVVHVGDMAYTNPALDPHVGIYEQCIGQYFGTDFIGGYAGTYGFGPVQNRFFPTLGNHDWDDAGIANYLDFFQIAKNPNERYYHYKRGPVHFIHYSGYAGVEPDGTALGSTQADWLQSVVEASDCPHIVLVCHFPLWTSEDIHYPGDTDLQTLAPFLSEHGVIVVSGHSHNSEVLLGPDDVPQIITGTGGHSLRGAHSPASPYSLWRDSSDYGAVFFSATRTQITFDFITVAGVTLHSVTYPASQEGSGVCYVGDAAKSLFTLEIQPDTAAVEVGHSWAYRAFANYVDGTVEDVTERCVWTSDDSTVGVVGSNTGVALGNAPGVATLTAEYLGESDTAEFNVLHSCLDDPTEIIFVVDRSDSMGTAAGGVTRLEHVKAGIEVALAGFDETRDFAGLVSFAGDFDAQTEDAVLNPILTNNFQQVVDSLSLMVPNGARGIASGLDLALAEMTGERHVEDNRRAIILVVDGAGNVTNPDGDASSEAAAIAAAMTAAAASADAIKALTLMKLIVIGYNVTSTNEDDVRDLATPGYYFRVETSEELLSVLGGIANLLCIYDDYYYYYPPPDDPGPGACNYPKPDFTGLTKWDILRGCVDLAGSGPNGESSATAWDPRPGNGFYLDMVGTNPNNAPAHDTTCGKIRTKLSFSFVSGKSYKLSYYTCLYAPAPVHLTTSIGNSGEVLAAVTTLPAFGALVLVERSFVSPVTGSYPIIFDSEVIAPGTNPITGNTVWPTQGPLIDNVTLQNITDAVTMFSDNFDTENPCE